MEDCVFCKIAKGEIKAERTGETNNFISFLDINPVTNGHTLIISKKHFETILDMPETLGSELINFIKKTSLSLIKSGKAEGFNVAQSNYKVAGQEVPHLHFHIFPRKKGDGDFKFIKKDL